MTDKTTTEEAKTKGQSHDLPKLNAEARQGVWSVEEMKNHGTSASDQFMSYGIECGGHTILDTLNSGGGVLEQEPADDDIGPFIWDEQAKRDLTFVAALVNAYRSGDVVLASTTPAPATPPGVPDSVRALSEASIGHDLRERIFKALAAYHMQKTQQQFLTNQVSYRLTREAAFVAEALLATHPAGQSAGSGADARTVMTEACKPWEHYTGEPPDDGSPLSGVFVAGMVYTERLLAKLLDVTHYEGGDGSEDFDNDATQTLRNILTGAGLWDADENRAVKPAPVSTRTGDEGTEELREEVAYWRRDLSARLWSMTALYKAALERGEGDRAADLANALRSALASYHDAEAGEWHDRCELCGEFVRDGEARAAWEDVSGHARCLSEDEKGHVDPHGDEDLARRVEEAQAALDASWPEAALAARPAAPEAQGAWRSRAADDVLAERHRQVEVEGWTPKHDDTHSRGEMACAAACYATGSDLWTGHEQTDRKGRPTLIGAARVWPWSGWWKPADRRHNLVKAGALILAEIERLDRLPAPPSSSGQGGR